MVIITNYVYLYTNSQYVPIYTIFELLVIREKLSKDCIILEIKIGTFEHNCLAQYFEILVHNIIHLLYNIELFNNV